MEQAIEPRFQATETATEIKEQSDQQHSPEETPLVYNTLEPTETPYQHDQDTTYVVPSVATAFVQDLTSFTDQELADKLPTIGINFTCKVCKATKSSLRELMLHLEQKKCQRPEVQGLKRKRGRPKKSLLASGDPPESFKPKKTFEIPQADGRSSRYTTRMSTGAIKRKNIAEILDLKIEPEDTDDEYQPKRYHKNSNQRIPSDSEMEENSHEQPTPEKQQQFTVVEEFQVEFDSPIKAETDIFQEEEEREACSENMDSPLETATDQHQEVVVEPGAKQDDACFVQMLPSAATDILKKSLTHLPKGTKVSLIPQTIVDIKTAQAKGQMTKPVVTIKADDGQGSIVIPTPTESGETKHMVIPNTLLLEALKEHKKRNTADDSTGNCENQQDIPSKGKETTRDEVREDTEIEVTQEENENMNCARGPIRKAGRHVNKKKSSKTSRLFSLSMRGRRRPFRCPHCIVRYFATKLELEVHLSCHIYKDKGRLVAAEEKRPLCVTRDQFHCPEPSCHFEIKNWNRMLYHLLKHESICCKLKGAQSVRNLIGSFQCPVCRKIFEKKPNMVSHWRTVHSKAAKTCEVCSKVFHVDQSTFQRHVEKCRGIVLHCDQCSYKTPISLNLKKHQKIHTLQAFKCDMCEKVFSTKQRLKVHIECHETNRTRHPCSQCEKLFLTVDAMKKHFARVHTTSAREFACDKCSYITKIESDLTKHCKLVHNKKYKCEQDKCDYMTNSALSYQTHQEYHRPENVFPCVVSNCYYRSPNAALLNDHCAKVHNTDSKHQCPICQKFFRKKTHLLRHLVTHTGDKPYSCAECQQSFYSHSTYYRHRSKTGHDQNREGISSVPQNIVITYIQEGKDDIMLDYSVKDRTESVYGIQNRKRSAIKSGQPQTGAAPNVDITQAVQSIEMAAADMHVEPSGQEEVVLVETSEAQFLQEIHMGDLADQQIITESIHDNNMEITEQVDPNSVSMLNHVVLPNQTMDASGLTHDGQILENIITIPEGEDGQQYTYILSAEEAESVFAGGQFQVTASEDNQFHVTAPEIDSQVALEQTLLEEVDMPQEQLQQEIVYKTGSVGNMETIVEVTPPGGGQQYAILLVPSAGGEPEAALSMLQLQSSL